MLTLLLNLFIVTKRISDWHHFCRWQFLLELCSWHFLWQLCKWQCLLHFCRFWGGTFCYWYVGGSFCCNYAVRSFCSTYAGISFCNKYVDDNFYCNYADGNVCYNCAGGIFCDLLCTWLLQVTISYSVHSCHIKHRFWFHSFFSIFLSYQSSCWFCCFMDFFFESSFYSIWTYFSSSYQLF